MSNPWIHMETKKGTPRPHLELLKLLALLCYGIRAHASKPRRVSSSRFSDKALPDEDVQGKIRDRKLIMGSTQHFSSHLRSIIMRNTSASCCEGMESGQMSARHTRGEKTKVLLFLFFSCPSFALISPEPDDSMGDADWRERGPCVCQKLGDERTKYGKKSPSYE